MRIGIFDSGIGGITVLAEAVRRLPGTDFMYYADEKHVPYGPKPREKVIGYTDAAFRFLTGMGADAVVIACNTATSAAAAEMRRKYALPIIGMEPALLPAARKYPSGRILVCATKTTVRGEKLRDLIETSHSAPELKAMPKLVEFAEHGTFGGPEVSEYLRRRIGSKDYDAVVLGCTHFIYFREAFAEHFGGKADIIDGNRGTVNRLVSLLPPERIREDEGKQGKVTFYTSASGDVKGADGISRERFSELLGTCLGRPADDR